METSKEIRLAVLIDADNVPYSNVKGVMEEIAKYGTPTFKRIYGDWTKPTVSGWKNVLLENAITPIQQYSYTQGKNSSDSALIIDAMDILYSGKVDGFCIVSSDSDFTRLATRLREAGMKVFGIGQKKTPNPFIVACDKFIYMEIIPVVNEAEAETPAKTNTRRKSTKPATAAPTAVKPSVDKLNKETLKLIAKTINDLADENGWAFLGDIGNLLLKKQPNFDPRNYGFAKLTPLLKSLPQFEIDKRETDKSGIKLVYIRNKEI
ncbi:NYN domain-containing protein [Ferruginibacter sp. HRS2-29]|uniref:NYN domain-containing protein n=1 Tax=Ferruginibacter sp. HRS2-29 TaxID=2487334 RepID=UPI0020CCC5BC|nr:NYN domain-containing protein [Ferruginibacter sp. HRS2-29]MCP9753206.1 NYN domain-containing protein [Ferruginibacter sp. HRS2-29]